MTRALILGAGLLALAACSTQGHLLAPDPEAAKLISPEQRPNEGVGFDSVCGTWMNQTDTVWRTSYEGQEYVFHSEECRKQFEDNPEIYSATVR